jgi:hypothetical protein
MFLTGHPRHDLAARDEGWLDIRRTGRLSYYQRRRSARTSSRAAKVASWSAARSRGTGGGTWSGTRFRETSAAGASCSAGSSSGSATAGRRGVLDFTSSPRPRAPCGARGRYAVPHVRGRVVRDEHTGADRDEAIARRCWRLDELNGVQRLRRAQSGAVGGRARWRHPRHRGRSWSASCSSPNNRKFPFCDQELPTELLPARLDRALRARDVLELRELLQVPASATSTSSLI